VKHQTAELLQEQGETKDHRPHLKRLTEMRGEGKKREGQIFGKKSGAGRDQHTRQDEKQTHPINQRGRGLHKQTEPSWWGDKSKSQRSHRPKTKNEASIKKRKKHRRDWPVRVSSPDWSNLLTVRRV